MNENIVNIDDPSGGDDDEMEINDATMDGSETRTNLASANASASASAEAVDLTNSEDDDDDENNNEEEEDRKLPARDESAEEINIGEDQWSCPRCTFLNTNTSARCSMCHYLNHDIQLQPNRNVSRADQNRNRVGSLGRQQQQQQQQSIAVASPLVGYIRSGALLGAAVGMTGNWVQGRNMVSGALEGGTTGALGGALLHEVLQNNNNNDNNSNSNDNSHEPGRPTPQAQADHNAHARTTSNENITASNDANSASRISHQAEARNSFQNSASSNSFSNVASARPLAARGGSEYSTMDRRYENSNYNNNSIGRERSAAGRSHRMRNRYGNDPRAGTRTFSDDGITHIDLHQPGTRTFNRSAGARYYTNDGILNIDLHRSGSRNFDNRGVTHRNLNQRGRLGNRGTQSRGGFERSTSNSIRDHPLIHQMMMIRIPPGNEMFANRRMYRMNNGDNIDSMNYEQLLNAFGNGAENMGADEREIHRLPVHTIGDRPLPEDARQCLICLEEFEKGDTRTILPCLHGFHKDCCHKWLKTNGKCPICKHPISSNE